MKKILLVLCLLSQLFVVGCNQESKVGDIDLPLPSIDKVVCDADHVGSKAKDNCNTCTCTYVKDHGYSWACTEIGCGVFS